MIKKFICVILLSAFAYASPFGCPAGSHGMPQTFKNCKAPVCHNGAYTGYGCNNGVCPYVCHGGACTQVNGPMGGPSPYPGRQMGNPYSMGSPYGMQDPNFGGYGNGMMPGMPGAGPNLMDPYGSSPYGGYDGYGYGHDMGYPSPSPPGSSRRGRSKRDSCSNGDCEDDEKSGESGKSNSGSSN